MDADDLQKLYAEGYSLSEIAKKYNTSITTMFRIFKRLNVKTDPKRRKSGNQCYLWKGGRIIRNGYRLILCKEHPKANYGGYVREHILIAEKHIGRFLKDFERVHHINGDRLDNNISNLKIMTDSEHKKLHSTGFRRSKKGKFGCAKIR